MNVVAAYLACSLIWGTTWFAIRVCIGPDGYPTFAAAALRFTVATLVLVPIYLVGRRRHRDPHAGPWGPRSRAQWSWVLLAGVLDAAGYALVYAGEETVPGSLAAVLFGTQPLLLALFATVTRAERVVASDLIGALVSIAGIVVVFVDRMAVSSDQALGVALVLGSVVMSTIYAMIMKRRAADLHAMAVTSIFIAVTALALWVVVGVRAAFGDWEPLPWPPPRGPTLALLYLGIFGSVIAFAAYFWMLQRLSLMVTGTLVFVFPIVALIADALWESHPVAGHAYVGITLTMAGLLISLGVRLGRERARRRAS